MKIIIIGATGFIGKEIVQILLKKGHEIVALSRNSVGAKSRLPEACKVVEWRNPKKDPAPREAFRGCDAVIHLAGERVASGRWTDEKKKEIFESRVSSTRNLISALKTLKIKPKTLICASALGFYGDRQDELLSEDLPAAEGFLAHTCECWEEEAFTARSLGVRTCAVRVGIVVGLGGGVLEKALPVFSKGLGGPLGNGKQWMSWIHVHDVANIFVHLAESDNLEGAFNAVAPNPVTNQEFTKTLSETLNRPAFFPAPKIVLKILFGEFGSFMLESGKLSAKKLLQRGLNLNTPISKGL